MRTYYFWNESLPNLRPSSYPDPILYFDNLLYPADRFSWITNNADALLNQLDGNELSTGISPSFGKLPNTNSVFIVIEYVYKGSPAERAGLKRGDIIVSINDIDLNTTNYNSLFNQNSFTVTLGEYLQDGSIAKTSNKISLVSEMLQKDPVIHHEVLDYKGIKTGYIVYAEFISGDDGRWLNKLRDALAEIRAAGATELIVDLRYNPGGQMNVAGFLASAIAPPSVSTDRSVLIRMRYNKLVNDYFLEKEGPESANLVYKFPAVTVNMGLSRVIFLTARGSASASELLINGLEPYMDVIQIGEATIGKYYGSTVITDESEPQRHTYAMMPLIMKYENSEGFTDFENGLIPDIQVADNLFEAKPFGSLEDPLLSTALMYLNNEDLPARIKPGYAPYVKLPDTERLGRGNILIQTLN